MDEFDDELNSEEAVEIGDGFAIIVDEAHELSDPTFDLFAALDDVKQSFIDAGYDDHADLITDFAQSFAEKLETDEVLEIVDLAGDDSDEEDSEDEFVDDSEEY